MIARHRWLMPHPGIPGAAWHEGIWSDRRDLIMSKGLAAAGRGIESEQMRTFLLRNRLP
jgi:hypothetical protein